jgi:hypothetical protein
MNFENKGREQVVFYDTEEEDIDDWLKSIGIDTTYDPKETEQKKFNLSTMDKTLNYLDGFKQMISHYVGIRRRIKEHEHIASDLEPKNKETADLILEALKNPESKVYLGEILYDKFYSPEDCRNQPNPQTVLGNYSKLYSHLADKMNEIIKEDGLADKFVVLKDEIMYSEVMKRHLYLEPMTQYFYE